MPSWSIHLKVAKEVNKKLKLDKDLFTFGNLIPDVDADCKMKRYDAHYYGDKSFPTCPKAKMIDLDKFLKDYQNNLDNPLVMGYYIHLLTDQYFNGYFFEHKAIVDKSGNIVGLKPTKGEVIDVTNNHQLVMDIKHQDLELYGKYLYQFELLEMPKDEKKILNNIKVLKGQFYTEQNVKNRLKYLQTDFEKLNELSFQERIWAHHYKIFSLKELDDLVDNCIKYIFKEVKKLS